ncbi:MAG TPA: LacI family DNA-binding transcriptional regulator [Bacteroidota bacterium]|nr:LacI family DNA-binding transcriptional regulator [Bacteroidota bacterium]
MPITIYDIAREAKVGIGTVSRVFNNRPNVAEETRARILAIAERMRYQPHASAQALARKHAYTLSVIIPFFTNYFSIEVLKGMQDTLAETGYDILLHGVNNTTQIGEFLKRGLKKGRVDGMLFVSMTLSDKYTKLISEQKIPIVLVDTYRPEFDSIQVKNYEGAFQAALHLVHLGHKKIGMINANMRSMPAQERFRGFRDALEQSGIALPTEYVVSSSNEKQDGFNKNAGYLAMKELLETAQPHPTAVFVSSDVQAIGVLSAMEEKGMSAPHDIAVVGYDDIELAQHFHLTTMHQPMYEMGELAIRKIIHRIQSPNDPPTLESFTPALVVRETCGGNKEYSQFEEQTGSSIG